MPASWSVYHEDPAYAFVGECKDSDQGIYHTLFSFSCFETYPFPPVQNGAGPNQWFDGCIAVIDDDDTGESISNPGAIGMGCIYSDIYPVTGFDEVYVAFAYQNEPISNFGDFTVEVFNGQTWINILSENTSINGNANLSITQTQNPAMQFRFCYDDQNQWAFGAAIDNFTLTGIHWVPVPTCTDLIQNGNETGIDCGGSCPPCPTCYDGIMNGDETGIDCGGKCQACPTCYDGIMNGDETDIDCGGTCIACPTCYDNIQNGNETSTDCGGSICVACPTCNDGILNGNETDIDCGGNCDACPVRVKLRVFLEGFYDADINEMSTTLSSLMLIPQNQPFSNAPYHFIEEITGSGLNENTVDWVLLEARSATDSLLVLQRKAALLTKNGIIINYDGSSGVVFENLVDGVSYYFVIHHTGHLPIMSANPIVVSNNIAFDFTFSASQAAGSGSLKLIGEKYVMYGGDINGNGIVNASDYNLWSENSAGVNIYSSVDCDGNGVINNLDYNIWYANRSKISFPLLVY